MDRIQIHLLWLTERELAFYTIIIFLKEILIALMMN